MIQLPTHFVSRKTKRRLLAGAGGVAVALAVYLFISGLTPISAQAPQGGIFVEGKIELAPRGDINGNSEVDAGDTVILTFRIINSTDAEHAFATLATGIDSYLFYDLWNLQGAASLSEKDGKISFPNILLPPRSKQFVTVEATVKYFTAGEQHITLAIQLLDQEGKPIGTVIPNEHADRRVGPWEDELPWWIAEPVPTPTADPTPEPTPEEIVPSPEITPEIITPTPEI